MKVFLCPVSEQSLYARLLFRALDGRYVPVFREDGEIGAAIEQLSAGLPAILHVQWEEFFLRQLRPEDDPLPTVQRIRQLVERFTAKGGRIVLTIHNALPHEIQHPRAFLELRRLLADKADRVLVHNTASIDVLRHQLGRSIETIEILPHPSYAGVYEPEGEAERAILAGAPVKRHILGFGAMRDQKGMGYLLDALPEEFTTSQRFRLRISGHGKGGPRLKAAYDYRKDVDWDLRYVPEAEVGPMFRRAAALVLAYEDFLTSGVAHLALTLGAVIIAPDVPQMRELLPEPGHRFLYDRNDATDLQRAVREVLALPPAESRTLRLANLKLAEPLHPHRISLRLGAIYDELAAAMPPAVAGIAADLDFMDQRGLPPSPRPDEPVIGAWPATGEVGLNWGDKLNPVLIGLMSGRPVVNSYGGWWQRDAPAHLVIGSGLRTAGAKHVVWGSGLISLEGKLPAAKQICAVRGPLSREALLAAGIDCPDVLGDPALLMPLFYRPAITPTYDLGIIQHYRDAGTEPLPEIPEGMSVKVIDILGSITGVIDDILSCRHIVSSSLHGLIAAHAYGVPATWIKFGDRPAGDDFKFRDYLMSAGWSDPRPLWVDATTSCADLVGPMTRVTPLVRIPDLIAACPFIDPARRDALLLRASEVFPAMPPVSFLSAALPEVSWSQPVVAIADDTAEPLLSIIIGIRNWGTDRLELAVRTIRQAEGGDRCQILISDFGSDDPAPVQAIGDRFGCQVVYTEATEWSRSAAINAAAAHVSAPYLVTSDADILFAPKTLLTMRAYLDALPHAIHLMQYSDLPPSHTVAGLAAHDTMPWEAFELDATMRPRWGMGCIACARDVFDTVRGYDERMKIWGGEDGDFVARSRENGYPLNWIEHPDGRVFHIWHKSFQSADATSEAVHTHNKRLMKDERLERNFLPGTLLRPARPLVSVVIATRDRAELLKASLASVAAQTLQDFEIVVVDDGSQDHTPAMVAGFGDPRLRYVRLPESVGLPAARNIGNREARGKYIAVHDDDDLMLPHRLEQQIACLRPGDAGSYGGWVDFGDEASGAELTYHPGAAPFGVAELMFVPKLQLHPTLLLRRDLCLRHPYEERFRGGSDYHLASRIAMAGYPMRHCANYVTLRRLHGQNMTFQNADTQQVASRSTRAAILGFLSNKEVDAMREAANAIPPYPIDQPDLVDEIVDMLGEAYTVASDRLAYSQKSVQLLRRQGVRFAVVAQRRDRVAEPTEILLDRRDRDAYGAMFTAQALVPVSGMPRHKWRRRSFNTDLSDRLLPDNRINTPKSLPAGAETMLAQSGADRTIGLGFCASDWQDPEDLALPVDAGEQVLYSVECDGAWHILMKLRDESQLEGRLRAGIAIAANGAPSLYELTEEPLL